MNIQVKLLLTFTAGVLAGGLGMNYYWKDKHEVILAEELQSIRGVQKRKEDEAKKERGFRRDLNVVDDYASYNEIVRKEAYEPVESDFIDPDVPYLITPDEYANEKNSYEKEVIYYYSGDEVAINENEEIIQIEDYIGDNIDAIQIDPTGDSETVYVRNESIASDFEVIRIEGDYKRLIAGEVDDE